MKNTPESAVHLLSRRMTACAREDAALRRILRDEYTDASRRLVPPRRVIGWMTWNGTRAVYDDGIVGNPL